MRWIFPARLPDVRDVTQPAHDGDSAKLECDLGFQQRSILPLRLKDVFAPELRQPGGVETQRFTAAWLATYAQGPKWPFAVETFQTRTGADLTTFERYVGIVYAGDPEEVRRMPGYLPCLNTEITTWLADKGWGGGIGG